MNKSLSIILIAGLLCGCVIVFYGSRDWALMDPDEARYAEASKEMIEQKSFIVPLYNDAPRLNKPILFYWFQIASFFLLGVNELAARLPSMGAGLVSILLAFFIASFFYDRRTGVMAVFIFIGNFFFFAFSKIGTLDIVLLFFFTLSLFAFLKAEASAEQRMMKKKKWYLVLFAFSLGLSFLTKGPVGIIVPLLIIVLYLLFTRKLSPFSWKNIALSILVFLAVVIPWGGALIMKIGTSEVFSLIGKETAERYFVGFDHPQPFYFFILVFFAGFFPWSSFVPVALARSLRFSFGAKSRKDLFLILWLVVPIIFFSFSGSKLPGYILPVLPAASVITAAGFVRSEHRKHPFGSTDLSDSKDGMMEEPRKKDWLLISGFMILMLVLFAYLMYGYSILGRFADFRIFYFSTMFICILYAAIVIVFFLMRVRNTLLPATALFAILFLLAINFFAMPEFQKMRSMKDLVVDRISAGHWDRVVSYRYNLPSLLFYSDREVKFADDEDELRSFAGSDARSLIVISEKNYKTLSDESKGRYEIDGEWRNFILLVPRSKDRP